jgi:hypothetical protein
VPLVAARGEGGGNKVKKETKGGDFCSFTVFIIV